MKYFVTGTDTEIGKTTVTVGLVSAVVKAGFSCVGLKPVAAGQDFVGDTWINEDVLRLSQVCQPAIDTQLICSHQFRTPCAPKIAAELEGKVIDREVVLEQVNAAMDTAQYAFIEGVGGFNIPLSADWTTADLAVDLNCPVILVVGLRLGCVNHAVLTREAILSRGLKLAGWVANEVDPNFGFVDENVESLKGCLDVPCLGRVPFMSECPDQIGAGLFQLEYLLRR